MPEHLRTDRQETLTNSDATTNSQNVGNLPQVDSGITIGGSWYPVYRPLATKDGANPLRGAEGHGADNKDVTFLPERSGITAPMYDDPGDTQSDFTDLLLDADPYTPGRQDPVLVSIVPEPKQVVTRFTRVLTPFDGVRTSYTGAALSGPDVINAYTLPADPNRQRVTIRQFSTYCPSANRTALYYFAFSHNQQFSEYTVLESASVSSFHTPFAIENCTNPLYFTILPIAAYDPTKANFTGLSLVVETATIANVNPVK